MSARESDTSKALALRRRRLAQLLFVVTTVSFLALVLVMALLPEVFATPLGGGPVTVAMVVAAIEIALILVATGLFARAANRLQDREEALRRNGNLEESGS